MTKTSVDNALFHLPQQVGLRMEQTAELFGRGAKVAVLIGVHGAAGFAGGAFRAGGMFPWLLLPDPHRLFFACFSAPAGHFFRRLVQFVFQFF